MRKLTAGARLDGVDRILLTIDVEDWFQVQNLKERIPFSSWSSQTFRVEENTHRILDLLDSWPLSRRDGEGKGAGLPCQPSAVSPERKGYAGDSAPRCRQLRATFFVLGWVAERLPSLVREISLRGHEVASHGCHHHLCNESSAAELRKDLLESRSILEDITGRAVLGYRAPSFSVNNDVLRIIEECGYLYDSSFNSFSMNERYGRLDLSWKPSAGIARQLSPNFYELAISNVEIAGKTLPLGGGGYFRLMPWPLFMLGMRRILSREGACLLYLHPWEIDPDQPRVEGLPRSYRFRHYVNLEKTLPRLRKLVKTFKRCRFVTCQEYLESIVPRCHPAQISADSRQDAG